MGSVLSFVFGQIRSRGRVVFLIGLAALFSYWYSVHPRDFARGYTEDWCHPEQTRQLMAEALDRKGGPDFTTQSFGAPEGISLPFMSWGMEISWLGGYFWKWDRDFPYLWALFGFSLLISFLGVGWILRKMKLAPEAAWGLAAAVVLLHVPRHFKIWHHYEHLLDHWVYWSFFLDAWIWQRFWRERRWSWSLEAWRGVCLLGMMATAGYFWGPLILLWAIVRGSMLAVWLGERVMARARGSVVRTLKIEGAWRHAWLPVLLASCLVVLELRWFLPLSHEVKRLGTVWQGKGWFGHWPYILRPLWLEDLVWGLREGLGVLVARPQAINVFETVVTPGWFFVIPFLVGLVCAGREGDWEARMGKPARRLLAMARAVAVILPFFLLFIVAVAYLDEKLFPSLAQLVQSNLPFMSFFRVSSRWGLFFPALFGVMIALCWPEMIRALSRFRDRHPRRALALLVLFAVSSAFEASRLRTPVSTIPALSSPAAQILEEVRRAPGTTVLDLPFCLAGGNGVCSQMACPNYPSATTGACFRGWHDKRVYGIYASRLVFSQCEVYNRAPYLSWFDAWRTQRCFTEAEWGDFCSYLDQHAELSAVLLYPDIWSGAGSPECLDQFKQRLGPPLGEAQFVGAPVRGDERPVMSRLMRFSPRCVRR
jgi:hypothetical protein